MKIKHLATLALAVGFSATSVAQTPYGGTISNTATLDYSVNSQSQDQQSSAPAIFLVDRKVVVNVSTPAPSTLSTAVVGTAQVITYEITNFSNAFLGMKFDVTDSDTGGITYSGLANDTTDNTTGPNITYQVFLDANANGTYEIGTDITLIASSDVLDFIQTGYPNVALDPDSIFVHVVATPTEGVDASVFAHDLVVTAVEPTTGAALPDNNTDAWIAGTVQTIFADGGIFKGRGGISISSATLLQPTKTAAIVSDPINGTTDPKAVPGAVVEYVITITNTGSVDATAVIIKDDMPLEFDNTTFTYTIDTDIADGNGLVETTSSTAITGTTTGTGTLLTFPTTTVPANVGSTNGVGGVNGLIVITISATLL